MKRFAWIALLVALFLALSPMTPPAGAQSIFATIVGTVTDPSSAVLAGAKVAVRNVNTNERREFTTNASGNYEINNLFPGVYVLEVETAGFAKYRRENIDRKSVV